MRRGREAVKGIDFFGGGTRFADSQTCAHLCCGQEGGMEHHVLVGVAIAALQKNILWIFGFCKDTSLWMDSLGTLGWHSTKPLCSCKHGMRRPSDTLGVCS